MELQTFERRHDQTPNVNVDQIVARIKGSRAKFQTVFFPPQKAINIDN